MSMNTNTSIDGINLEGKYLVVKEECMTEDYRDVTWRVVKAYAGFGCSPTARGRAVYVTYTRDGEQARIERYDVERLATGDEVSQALALRIAETGKVDA